MFFLVRLVPAAVPALVQGREGHAPAVRPPDQVGQEQFSSKRQVGYRDLTGEGPPSLEQWNTPPRGAYGPLLTMSVGPAPVAPTAQKLEPKKADVKMQAPVTPAAVDVRPPETEQPELSLLSPQRLPSTPCR